jgi:hypothetical protein
MKSASLAGGCAAMFIAFSMAAFAQDPAPQSPTATQRTPPGATSAATAEQVTITGCVQREADYRKANNAGRAGVAGTGLGANNEFVLINASMAGGGAKPGAPTGTAGSTAAFELTGSAEGQAAQFVGKRVEVMGKLKAEETSASGRPTGGPTAGKPPEGVDVASSDLKLREIDVTFVKEASGTCPAP